VGFEPTISVLERAKTIRALDRAATSIYITQNFPCALLIKHYDKKTYGVVEVETHVFLNSALVGGNLEALAFLPPGKESPGTHLIRGRVGRRTGLDAAEKRKFSNLLGLELRPVGRPTRTQSTYRLHYSGCSKIIYIYMLA
jgi:hypothetical protein